MTETANPLLSGAPLRVINLGAELFADALRDQSVPVQQVLWTPPRDQDEDLMTLLDDLL